MNIITDLRTMAKIKTTLARTNKFTTKFEKVDSLHFYIFFKNQIYFKDHANFFIFLHFICWDIVCIMCT